MTTTAPQWPGQDEPHGGPTTNQGMTRRASDERAAEHANDGRPQLHQAEPQEPHAERAINEPRPRRPGEPWPRPILVRTPPSPDGTPGTGATPQPLGRTDPASRQGAGPDDAGSNAPGQRPPAGSGHPPRRLQAVPEPKAPVHESAGGPAASPGAAVPAAGPPAGAQTPTPKRATSGAPTATAPRVARGAGRRNRFVVVRDAAEQELWAARRRARARLPSPAAVTRDIALALLEVEAGCRSAAQLERIFSPELWAALEHRIGRRGGPLPSGRSLISVLCQEDAPGLADTVAVVHKGDLVRPVALRLDAGGGRWTVTELRWWRNETDTARTPGRDGGLSG
jgi:hypothetical protein